MEIISLGVLGLVGSGEVGCSMVPLLGIFAGGLSEVGRCAAECITIWATELCVGTTGFI